MEKTPVQWLVEKLEIDMYQDLDDNTIKIIDQAMQMENEQKGYSEEEVTKLLISCKDRFGGSELYDYTHDDEVKEWFEQTKKTFKSE